MVGALATGFAWLLALRALEGLGFLLVAMPAPGLIRRSVKPSELGARMNYVESTDSRLASNEITFTKLQSNNEDIDVAKASVEVSSAQSVYEAALSVTAKVTKASLVDYLR